MSVATDPHATGPRPELSATDLERLRGAALWARFIAIVGLIASVLFVLMVALIVTHRLSMSLSAYLLVTSLISIAATASAAALLWAYAQNVASFSTEGAAALGRAFRNLRQFFTVWTLAVAFDIATTILAMFGIR